jgi:hypothetical protein
MLSRDSRTIASFSVPFAPGTRVESVLYMVRSGATERVCSHTTMRSPETTPATQRVCKPWEKTVTLWLAEEPADEGMTKYS